MKSIIASLLMVVVLVTAEDGDSPVPVAAAVPVVASVVPTVQTILPQTVFVPPPPIFAVPPTVVAAPAAVVAAPTAVFGAPVVSAATVVAAPAAAVVASVPAVLVDGQPEVRFRSANRGAVHEGPLPGHTVSQQSLNLIPAPGTL